MRAVGFALIGTLTLAGTAHAQVPSTNDTSTTDGLFNTGMGTGALGGPTPANLTGGNNTASGARALFSNTTGTANTAAGYEALYTNTTGNGNTAYGYNVLASNNGYYNAAAGYDALGSNTSGSENTAFGSYALDSNVSGDNNTAIGSSALNANTTGYANSASGYDALASNTIGFNNTASGYAALGSNKSGSNNTASGYDALQSNVSGSNNTASGYGALGSNSTGTYNTASGYEALYGDTGGVQNTAVGADTLLDNKNGEFNTAVGVGALKKSANGKYNVGLGWDAGSALTGGSNNVEIGSPGVAADSGVIRIGTITNTTSTQSAAYIAGIYGVKTGTAGMAVVIDSSGQLGTVSSSIRYKEDIQSLANEGERLLKLRPVSFRYKKADALGEKPIQYGLIAEEVAKVYPELVVRNRATGRIDGVRYDELAPILLKQVQRQTTDIRDLRQQIAELKAINQATQVTLRELERSKDLVAQR